MIKNDKIIWTTKEDLSAHFFTDWKIYYYEDYPIPQKSQIVYFRDPFNSPDYQPDQNYINRVIKAYTESISIDCIRDFSDMQSIEDKFNQSRIFGDLMPRTFLPSEKNFQIGQHIAKPRISQRAKNILFDLDRELTDDWIIQERLDIVEEIRVYAVNSKIVDVVGIKSSKQNGKVKVYGCRKISKEEAEIVKEAMKKIPTLDFVGLDVAKLKDGNLKIIEVNRSPQFSAYYHFSNLNLAEKLTSL